MNIVEIPVRRLVVQYPSEWEEMDRAQAIYAGRMLFLLDSQKIDVDQFRKLMVDKFIRRTNNLALRLTPDDELDLWGNEWLLAETVNFFFKRGDKEQKQPSRYKRGKVVGVKGKLPHEGSGGEDDTERHEAAEYLVEQSKEIWEILPTFTKNLVPWFRTWKHGLVKYYGPGDFLQGMSFAEYKDSLAASMKFMETHDEAWLDRLTAILYRRRRPGLKRLMKRQDFDGRTRTLYNPAMIERATRRMKGVDPGIKYMALMYVSGCLWTLKNMEEGIEIDGVKMDFTVLFKPSGKEEADESVGMIGMMMALAESGVFGSLKDVANTDVWDVLVRIYQLELDRRSMEKMIDSSKHKNK